MWAQLGGRERLLAFAKRATSGRHCSNSFLLAKAEPAGVQNVGQFEQPQLAKGRSRTTGVPKEIGSCRLMQASVGSEHSETGTMRL